MVKLLAPGLLFIAAVAGGGAAMAGADRTPVTTSALDLVVQRAQGPAVALRFEVATSNPQEAAAAARAAVPELVPGGLAVGPVGGVTGQWAQWGWAWSDAELPVAVAYNSTGAPDFVAPDSI